MEFEYYALSHSGYVRDNNEDYFSIPDDPKAMSLTVVADGMGGHKSGEVASRLAVDTFKKSFAEEEVLTLSSGDRLLFALEKANAAVYNAAHDKIIKSNMGTTLTACYIEGNRATFLNVGDSRAYLVRDSKIQQITQDHSMVQELLKKEIITEAEAQNHPQKNVITRAIGINPTVLGDIFIKDIKDGDYIVLCTDGLTSHIQIDDVSIIFQKACTPESIATLLVELALAQGGTDNVTVALIYCSDLPSQKDGDLL